MGVEDGFKMREGTSKLAWGRRSLVGLSGVIYVSIIIRFADGYKNNCFMADTYSGSQIEHESIIARLS